MCLGVPGKVTRVEPNPIGLTMGTVSFGGIQKEVCLAYIEDPQPGDWVIVHVGFAISRIDEQEAAEVFELLRGMGELADLELPSAEAQAPAAAPAPTAAPAEPPAPKAP
jgi:hydrogenase expression/formation protein HypC